ncbi:MAG TPA: Hsp70 family protein [Pyrinomonadaceae bacterium]|nr:Hsp70 family protein [Pyrinomonadaceae bacterium]
MAASEPMRKVLVERDTPAVGGDGALVEDIGIETLGGVFTPLLKTGCRTPCRDTENFGTAQDNQTSLEVSLFRGKENVVSKNHALGVCHVVGLPKVSRGMLQVLVTVEAADRQIILYAVDNVTKKPYTVECESKSLK